MGLRTARGIRLNQFEEEFGCDLRQTHGHIILDLLERGLAIQKDNCLRLTPEGLVTAEAIARELALAD